MKNDVFITIAQTEHNFIIINIYIYIYKYVCTYMGHAFMVMSVFAFVFRFKFMSEAGLAQVLRPIISPALQHLSRQGEISQLA